MIESAMTPNTDALREALNELIVAASNCWGRGSTEHNLVRDVSDAVVKWMDRPVLAATPSDPLLDEVRRRALEEAARVAEGWKSPLRPGTDARLLGHQEAARAISAAIRALTISQSGEGL